MYTYKKAGPQLSDAFECSHLATRGPEVEPSPEAAPEGPPKHSPGRGQPRRARGAVTSQVPGAGVAERVQTYSRHFIAFAEV